MSTSERLPEADPVRTGRLREALRAANFTADGLLDLLGGPAYAALARSETVPALRATRGTSPLETLVRLFLLQQSVPRERARDALPLDEVLEDGWLVPAPEPGTGDGELVRASVDVRPYGGPQGQDWWIVADLGCAVGGASGAGTTEGTHGRDVVLGVGGASTTLAGITIRKPVARALDIGTGSGFQALHAAQHATRVTATDLNPRAVTIAGLTLTLSGASGVDLREGTLFEPVAGEEPYDLIVSNPPFVISPGARLTYRDGGMSGDDLCRTLVENAGEWLAPGGYCQLLANWEHPQGQDWRERLRSWVPAGCDAWIVQREEQDVTQYAELWLRDAGDHRAGEAEYEARYGEWLDEFERRGTTAVGLGWITLRKSGAEEPAVVVEEWPHPVEQPLGDEVVQHFERQDFLRATDDAALLDCHFQLAEGVVQEQVGMPGAEDPEHVVLRQQRGMRRATKVDTVGAGFAGVCDGSLPAWRILDAIAQLVGEDPVMLRDRTPGAIRLLVEQGFLLPVEPGVQAS
ncbi:methyltransferase [Streptomyces bathyalis]|uniref:Methyltransferase n=1 Tax=Streptomyces bathyalis TaxID=2710756 RepID=A0A7T1T6H1_9ACTN|nr:methyltransferase [Streptomyces bathyalis]QPP07304.1 methyltransferase [Streptomyces bathyalis]